MDEKIELKIELGEDLLLELIGGITKLNVILREIPEELFHHEQLVSLLDRYGILLESVDALPIKIMPVGDA